MIIVGPDGPTIGGYPRLGTIIEADLHLVPRLAIGTQIRFVPVDFESATRAVDERSKQLDSVLRQIRISQIQI
jgi:allophanate hydrolase subunit 2